MEPSTSSSQRETQIRKKRIKTQNSSSSSSTTTTNPNSLWKSEKTQEIYSTKLMAALRHVRITPSSPSAPRRSRAVREAADTALAVAAKGRTRWSRAILSNKIKLKYLNNKHKRRKVNINGPNKLPPSSSSTKKMVLRLKGKEKDLPGVERKVKTLGRLVPGCRKETLPVILEEATDYIPALEMQIRAMRDLLLRLSAASNNPPHAPAAAVEGSSSSSSSGSGLSAVVEDGDEMV